MSAPTGDGGAAAVVCSEEFVRRHHLWVSVEGEGIRARGGGKGGEGGGKGPKVRNVKRGGEGEGEGRKEKEGREEEGVREGG